MHNWQTRKLESSKLERDIIHLDDGRLCACGDCVHKIIRHSTSMCWCTLDSECSASLGDDIVSCPVSLLQVDGFCGSQG